MKRIREMAEDYAVEEAGGVDSDIFRVALYAHLAGAKAALELAAKEVATKPIILESRWGRSALTRVKVGSINVRRELARHIRKLGEEGK